MTLIFTFTESLRRFWNEALRLSVVNNTPNAKTFPFTQGISGWCTLFGLSFGRTLPKHFAFLEVTWKPSRRPSIALIYVKMVNNNTRLYNNETKNCNYVALALASVHQGLKKGLSNMVSASLSMVALMQSTLVLIQRITLPINTCFDEPTFLISFLIKKQIVIYNEINLKFPFKLKALRKMTSAAQDLRRSLGRKARC